MRRDSKIISTLSSFLILAALGAGCDDASVGRGSDAGEPDGDTDAEFDDSAATGSEAGNEAGSDGGDGEGDGVPGDDAEPEPEPTPSGEVDPDGDADSGDAEPPVCTLDDVLGERPGDATWTDLSCEVLPEGDERCVADVWIGADGGVEGSLQLLVRAEGMQFTLAFDRNPDMPVFDAYLASNDDYEFVNRLERQLTLAQALELDPDGPEVAAATIDIVKLLEGVGPTVPQPTATWCERACQVANAAVCGGISGAAAGCCVATAGVCCAPGAAAAAITCLNAPDCEKRCDSSNL